MKLKKRISRFVNDRKHRFKVLERRGLYSKLDDRKYSTKKWKAYFGTKIDFDNPKTFNEKMQWLKVYDRKPEYTMMVDKYLVKDYVAKLIGEEYIIPTLGVWNSYDEIDFDSLTDKFVLKCTHDSASVTVIEDKNSIDHAYLKEFYSSRLAVNYFYKHREWPYKNVKPRIIAEKFIKDDINPELRVYKVFNFGGVPNTIQMINGDKTDHEYINYYDTDWNLLELRQNYPNGPVDEKPACLDEMLRLSEKLSGNLPFIRTDFFVVNGKVLFSEFTFFSDAGFAEFEPEKWDRIFGDLIKLPEKSIG